MLVVLIFVVFLGACLSAVIAGGKNRSGIGWFFIGMLFPLLGVILAIVLPPNPPAEVASHLTDAWGQPLNWWNIDAK